MSLPAVAPYLAAAAFPLLLLVLYAIFRWSYLRSIRRSIYPSAPATPTGAGPVAPAFPVAPVRIEWSAADELAAQPRPAALVEAQIHTRAMRRAFAAAGALFTVLGAATVWYGRMSHGNASRGAVAVAALYTGSGLFLTLMFLRLSLVRSLVVVLGWVGVQALLILTLTRGSWQVTAAVLSGAISLNSLPVLAVGLLALRTTRALTAVYVPAFGLLIVFSTVVAMVLAAIGMPIEGTPTSSAVLLGVVALATGVAIVVRQIRRGLTRRFVLAWIAGTGVALAAAWMSRNEGLAPLAGIGVNGVMVLAGWGLFRLLLRLRRRGHIPDDVLQFSGCWLALCVFIGAVAELDWFQVPWLLLPFVAYAVALYATLSRHRAARARAHEALAAAATHVNGTAPRLLLLRVFQKAPAHSWLIDRLDDSWRRVGAIDLVVGLDLALRTLNAFALENFLLGRVHRHFFQTTADVQQRLPRIGTALAVDGRYPLNELYCLPDTWEEAVSWLAPRAAVVLMDLRGLGPANRGAILELSLVIARVPLSRIVILSGQRTDEDLLAQAIADAWAGVAGGSPNAEVRDPTVRVLRCSGRRRIDAAAMDIAVFRAAFDPAPASLDPTSAV